MTENKRFQYNVNKNSIEYNNKHFAYCNGEQSKIANKLNELVEENKQCKEYNAKLYSNSMKSEKQLLKQIKELKEENTMLKEHQNINCQNCQYFVSDSASSDCLKREDIGYKGTCIDGMDLHMLAKNCPYY